MKNNWACEKNPYQVYMREIRKQTRLKYPIPKDLKCDFCNDLAIHHHHYTKPAHIDLFFYVCNDCHRKIHGGELINFNSYIKEVI